MKDNSTLYVFDIFDGIVSNEENVLYWTSYKGKQYHNSILYYVEKNACRLREKYLDFVNGIEVRAGKKIDVLRLENGFNFWQMSTIVEKSYLKTDTLKEVLCLLALEEIITAREFNVICIETINSILIKTLRQFCKSKNLVLVVEEGDRSTRVLKKTSIIVNAFGGVLGLLAKIWRYRKINYRKPIKVMYGTERKMLTLVSYFFNLRQDPSGVDTYYSDYWTNLSDFLREEGYSTNYIHLFNPTIEYKTIEDGIIQTTKWTKNECSESHRLIQEFYSISVSWRIILKYFSFFYFCIKTRPQKWFVVQYSHLNLWEYYKDSFYESLIGSEAISNLFYYELFKRMTAELSDSIGLIYLCENQPWEKAMLHTLRTERRSVPAIAVPHSTVRFWDLRYFENNFTVSRAGKGKNANLPDMYAVNGPKMTQELSTAGFPDSVLLPCEALRFNYLKDFTYYRTKKQGDPVHVLILGDYQTQETMNTLSFVNEAIGEEESERFCFDIKPHPKTRIDISVFPNLRAGEVINQLGEILNNYDVVLSSNSTSAAVDCFYSGIPVIVIADSSLLNFSPLRDTKGVTFTYTIEELRCELNRVLMGNNQEGPVNDFFYLGNDLSRWKKIIDNLQHNL